MLNPHIVRKMTDPISPPPEAGIHWLNTSTGKAWFSTGTTYVSDWSSNSTSSPSISGTITVPLIILPSVGIAITGTANANYIFIKCSTRSSITTNPRISSGSFIGQELTLACDDGSVIISDSNNPLVSGIDQSGDWDSANSVGITYWWTGVTWREKSRR